MITSRDLDYLHPSLRMSHSDFQCTGSNMGQAFLYFMKNSFRLNSKPCLDSRLYLLTPAQIEVTSSKTDRCSNEEAKR
ncbi:hypothetical protein HNY73_006306 [Argiope bruennichi]|uniref:Uncharacterized protein n=1 Tax=Argiope bruennichi TaxID=94029 RepID=A0A8T0FM33_ARGBR|nr:hypothetical protein HNY73_006306 [Argiope bruennichi]